MPATMPGAGARIVADTPAPIVFKVIASERPGAWLFTRKPDAGSDFSTLGTSSRTIAKDISLSLRGGGIASTTLTVSVEGN